MVAGVRRLCAFDAAPWFVEDEFGYVLSGWYLNLDGVRRAFGLVVLAQAFTQTMCFDTYDGVGSMVELLGAPERFNRDCIFFDLLRDTLEILGANIRQKLREVGGSRHKTCAQDGIELLPFPLETSRSRQGQTVQPPSQTVYMRSYPVAIGVKYAR